MILLFIPRSLCTDSCIKRTDKCYTPRSDDLYDRFPLDVHISGQIDNVLICEIYLMLPGGSLIIYTMYELKFPG